MSITKRQHYIPRSVIKYFSADGEYIFEGQIKFPNKFYKTNINNAMCSKNIYEHRLLEINAVENFFASTVDAALSSFHREILILLESSKVFEAKRCFANYAESILRCYFRSGAILEEYNTAYKSQKGQIILHLLADTPNNYLKGLRHTILNDYHFSVIKNNDIGFVLGDSYLTTTALAIKSRFSNASNRQIGYKETMLLLPISPFYCLVFYHGRKPKFIYKDTINQISNTDCLEINLAIFHASYNKILSRKEAFFYRRDYEIMKLISPPRFSPKDLDIGSYDLCYCGSGKLHKNCCIEKTKILKNVFASFSDNSYSEKVLIRHNTFVENAISIPQIEYEDEINVINKTKP